MTSSSGSLFFFDEDFQDDDIKQPLEPMENLLPPSSIVTDIEKTIAPIDVNKWLNNSESSHLELVANIEDIVEKTFTAIISAKKSHGLNEEIEEIEFFANFSLPRRRAMLQKVAEKPVETEKEHEKQRVLILSHCDSIRKNVLRIVFKMLEPYLSKKEGRTPRTDLYEKEVERARKTRKTIRSFVVQSEKNITNAEGMQEKIRRMGNAIAILRSSRAFPFMYIDDRKSLADLRLRAIEWLSKSEEEKDSGAANETGNHLLEDYENTVRFMLQINKRQELVLSDAELMEEVINELEETSPSNVKERLQLLIGRDSRLDEVIINLQKQTSQSVRAELERTLSELQRSSSNPDIFG